MRSFFARAVIVMSCLLACTLHARVEPPDDPPSSEPPRSEPNNDGPSWNKVKSAQGIAKARLTHVKFAVKTQNWRLKIKTAAVAPGPNNPADGSIRLALMVESKRDTENKPMNWQQVMVIWDGKPGEDGSKVFDSGPTKDGEEKWFDVTIVGHNSTYEITVDDQSSDGKAKSKSKSKSKSKPKSKKES